MADEATIASWQKDSPLMHHMGIELLDVVAGTSRLKIRERTEVTNRKGDVHGGAIAALVDFAVGSAIRSRLTGLVGMSTITLTINYLAPARGELIAVGEVSRIGKHVAFADATISDLAGEVVAKATGVFRIIRADAAQT